MDILTYVLCKKYTDSKVVSGGGVVVDKILSTTSTNPVENRAVTVAINELKESVNSSIKTIDNVGPDENGNVELPSATSDVQGYVFLLDSVESTSDATSHIAATPNSVKQAYDLANSAMQAADMATRFVVNIQKTGDTTYVADKTNTEINEAYTNGKTVVAIMEELEYQSDFIDSERASFKTIVTNSSVPARGKMRYIDVMDSDIVVSDVPLYELQKATDTQIGGVIVDSALKSDSENPVQNKLVYSTINELTTRVETLTYEPIEIVSFTNDVGNIEKGRTIETVTLNWELNKIPTTAKIDDVNVMQEITGTIAYSDLALTGNKMWILSVTDEKGATATKASNIQFFDAIYYGASAAPSGYDSAFVLSLANKELTDTKARTITVDAGAGEYIYYAVPTSLGDCSFNVGGLFGGFSKATTFDFTNTYGYTTSYDVYKSDNDNLGSTTIEIS